MAVIAQSDPYSIFMRRIGYSVGLERTLDRLQDLQELYVRNGDLTLSAWQNIVSSETGWKLRTDNIGDVFFSLGFIHRTHGDLLVLDNLDAAAVAGSMLKTQREQFAALSFVFLWSILVNDGEMFVNFLLAGFKEELIKEKLTALIIRKRKVLASALPGRDEIRRVSRVVSIERQHQNRGSAGGGRTLASLRRTEPLHTTSRTGSVAGKDPQTDFSDDYFRKVPPRRKDWARSLGLWSDKDGLTAMGQRFIDQLRSLGYIVDREIFILWPMDYELVRSGFKPTLLGQAKTMWETLIDFGCGYGCGEMKPSSTGDVDNVVESIRRMMTVYRGLHCRKAMLRREMPFAVVYPAFLAIACAKGEAVIDVPRALEQEQRGARRRVTVRRSRNTGGALSVKRQ